MVKRVLCESVLAGLCILFLGCASSDIKRQEAELHLRIGTGFLTQRKFPQAMSELFKAEELDPKSPIIQNNLGLAYFLRKEYGLAEQHLLNAIKLFADYSDAHNNLGSLYIELSRYNDAITQLNLAVKDPTYIYPEKAYLNLGIAYLRKGDSSQAINKFKKSMEANVKFCPAYNFYGQALFQKQKYLDAAESFDRALALCNNNYDEADYYGGLSFYKAGQVEKAIARLEEVQNRYPDSEYAGKARDMLKIIR